MEDNIIIVENAIKKYKDNIVLDSISVSFKRGKIYGIIGRNGCGKTVFFKAICGFSELTSGRIVVNGMEIGKKIDIPDNIGSLIETPGFLAEYSGYRNLKYLADIRKKIGKQEIFETMKSVGLDPEMKKHVGKYSLGMRQRLGIAQAIMEKPEILILDEPMNGLDNQGVEDIRKLLLLYRDDGGTILLASHNKEDIAALCDQVYEMDAGKLKRRETV